MDNTNVLMYPYQSPSPSPSPGANVTTMEDALKLAKALVNQQQVGGVRSAAEAKDIATRIMQQYLTGLSPPRHNDWDTIPKAARAPIHHQQQHQPRSPPDYSPQLSGSSGAISGNSANVSKPVSPLMPTPTITHENWHPESAKALEDYVDTHVNYYQRVVKPKKTFEDQICDQLSIALYDSVYLESRSPAKPTKTTKKVPTGVRVCPLLQNVCVSSHNEQRVRVRFPTVETDANLAKAATHHADYCLRYGEALPDPELDNVTGQNVMQINGALVGQLSDGELLQMAMDHWMQESRSRKNTEHYSQLMWRKVSRVGAGVSRGKFKAFVVCNYNAKADLKSISAVRSNLP